MGNVCVSFLVGTQHDGAHVYVSQNLPSQGSHVGKWNTTEQCEATSNQTSKSGSSRSLGSHTTRLKIESRKISKSENENSAPIPETKRNMSVSQRN